MSSPAMRPRMRAMTPKSRFSPIIGGPTNPLYLSLVSRGSKAVARLFNSFGRSGLGGAERRLHSGAAEKLFSSPGFRGRKSPRNDDYPLHYRLGHRRPAGAVDRVLWAKRKKKKQHAPALTLS